MIKKGQIYRVARQNNLFERPDFQIIKIITLMGYKYLIICDLPIEENYPEITDLKDVQKEIKNKYYILCSNS